MNDASSNKKKDIKYDTFWCSLNSYTIVKLFLNLLLFHNFTFKEINNYSMKRTGIYQHKCVCR